MFAWKIAGCLLIAQLGNQAFALECGTFQEDEARWLPEQKASATILQNAPILPWNVLIEKKTSTIGPSSIVCSGTIIPSAESNQTDLVLTAGHCIVKHRYLLRSLNFDQFKVLTGIQKYVGRYKKEQSYTIKHAKFLHYAGTDAASSNIVILKLERPIVYSDVALPLCLPKNRVLTDVHKQCLITELDEIMLISKRNIHTSSAPILAKENCGGLKSSFAEMCGLASFGKNQVGSSLACYNALTARWELNGVLLYHRKDARANAGVVVYGSYNLVANAPREEIQGTTAEEVSTVEPPHNGIELEMPTATKDSSVEDIAIDLEGAKMTQTGADLKSNVTVEQTTVASLNITGKANIPSNRSEIEFERRNNVEMPTATNDSSVEDIFIDLEKSKMAQTGANLKSNATVEPSTVASLNITETLPHYVFGGFFFSYESREFENTKLQRMEAPISTLFMPIRFEKNGSKITRSPWFAVIVKRGTLTPVCYGSVLETPYKTASKIILTSSKCVEQSQKRNYNIIVTRYLPSVNVTQEAHEQLLSLSRKIRTTETYLENGQGIELIKISNPAVFKTSIIPVKMDDRQRSIEELTNCYVSGIHPKGDVAQISVTMLQPTKCQTAFGQSYDATTQLCGKFDQSLVDVKLGSPLVCQFANIWYQQGVFINATSNQGQEAITARFFKTELYNKGIETYLDNL